MKKTKSQQFKSLLIGGILPVIVFTWVEDQYGTLYGLIAGMIFGIGEIIWEWITQRRVDPITWGGNGMLLALGGISLLTQEGVWFKLQPALIEIILAFVLWGSVLLKKQILVGLAQKQGGLPQDLETALRPGMGAFIQRSFRGLTLRLGLFFAIQGVLAVWAALYWSTPSWALLKGVGLTVSLIVYLVAESLVLRYRVSSIP